MKSLKIILVLFFVILTFSLLSAAPVIQVGESGDPGSGDCREHSGLKAEIRSLIVFPERQWNMEIQGDVTVSVTLDRENAIHVVRVSGENDYLVDHVDSSLDGKVIKGDSNWIGRVFSITIEFRKYL